MTTEQKMLEVAKAFRENSDVNSVNVIYHSNE